MLRTGKTTSEHELFDLGHAVSDPEPNQKRHRLHHRWLSGEVCLVASALVTFAVLFIIALKGLYTFEENLSSENTKTGLDLASHAMLGEDGTTISSVEFAAQDRLDDDEDDDDDASLRPRCFVEDGKEYCIPSIVGVCCVRAGSTALANYLNAHPFLSFGDRKEHQAFRFTAPTTTRTRTTMAMTTAHRHRRQLSPVRAAFERGPPKHMMMMATGGKEQQRRINSDSSSSSSSSSSISFDKREGARAEGSSNSSSSGSVDTGKQQETAAAATWGRGNTTFYFHGSPSSSSSSAGQWGVAFTAFSSTQAAALAAAATTTTTTTTTTIVAATTPSEARASANAWLMQFPAPLDRMSFARQFPVNVDGAGGAAPLTTVDVDGASSAAAAAAVHRNLLRGIQRDARLRGQAGGVMTDGESALTPPVFGRRKSKKSGAKQQGQRQQQLSTSESDKERSGNGVEDGNDNSMVTVTATTVEDKVEEEILRLDFDPTYFGGRSSMASQGAIASLLGTRHTKLMFIFRDPAHQACAKLAGRPFFPKETSTTMSSADGGLMSSADGDGGEVVVDDSAAKCWEAVGAITAAAANRTATATATTETGTTATTATTAPDTDTESETVEGFGRRRRRGESKLEFVKNELGRFVEGFEKVRRSGVCGHRQKRQEHPREEEDASPTVTTRSKGGGVGGVSPVWLENLHSFCYAEHLAHWLTATPTSFSLKQMHFIKSEELRDVSTRRAVVARAVSFTGASFRLNASLAWHEKWRPTLESSLEQRLAEVMGKVKKKKEVKKKELKEKVKENKKAGSSEAEGAEAHEDDGGGVDAGGGGRMAIARLRAVLARGRSLEAAALAFESSLEEEHQSDPFGGGSGVSSAGASGGDGGSGSSGGVSSGAQNNSKFLTPKEEEVEEEKASNEALERLNAMTRRRHPSPPPLSSSSSSSAQTSSARVGQCETAMRKPGGYLDTCNALLAEILQDQKWRWR